MSDLISMDHAAEPVFGAQLRGPVLLQVHDAAKCAGRPCCIHNPSDHHMATWAQNWRGDRGLMERLCPHGVGHPDPDDIAYKASRGEKHAGVHGCDGCCARPHCEDEHAVTHPYPITPDTEPDTGREATR